MKKAFALALALGLASAVALAQTATRIRASVVSFDGKTLVVRTAVGKQIPVRLTDATRIQYQKRISMADIKQGDFVGSAAMPGPDGKLVAREVHVFPEDQRGTGEGHRPMDVPNQTMTNASVAKTVKGASGQELVLQYKGGEKTIVVPPGVPVVTYAPGDRSLLVPGSAVNVIAQTAADGSVTATRVMATGKDGTRPN